MRLLHIILILFSATVAFLIWFGIGHGVAWVLEAGLNADVNKPVFVKVGMIIGAINGGWILFFGLIQNLIMKKSLKHLPKKY